MKSGGWLLGKQPFLRRGESRACATDCLFRFPLTGPVEVSMNSHPRAGHLVQQLEGYYAFEPVDLPPDPSITLDNELSGLLSAADVAVGRLEGLARTLPDADLFLACTSARRHC
jgi:hypothetical protein